MPYAIDNAELAEFQKHLVGTWSNKGVPTWPGGKPLSYNIMPLPQVEPQRGYPCCLGYVLKNFAYTEEIRFNSSKDPNAIAVPATAPNRGGRYTQRSRALFYDQRVRFAEGPQGPTGAKTDPDNRAKGLGDTVHVENGSWLYLDSVEQKLGPYGDDPAKPGPIVPQPREIGIAKQIAVPHGNSVLALGIVHDMQKGAPTIPNADIPYPSPLKDYDFPSWDISAFPYYTKLNNDNDYENPNPDLSINPNLVLREAVDKIKPNAFIYWRVDTDPVIKDGKQLGKGVVTNIPFEERRANVTCHSTECWLLSTNGGKSYDYLSYIQIIIMQIPLIGQPYNFPHVTANTVKCI
jgi:hypothetical protein